MKSDGAVIHELAEGDSKSEFTVGANEQLTLVLFAPAAKYVHAQITVRLTGSGAQATIIGLIMGAGKSQVRLETLQQHEARDTTSNLMVKSVLRGDAHCIIDGGIRVEKRAQKTDAYQRNENLLLSDGAYAESKPSLEILANDVRCTHGATVGPIPEEELWYLATRGIPRESAETLIAKGFLRSALDLVKDESVRYRILEKLEHQLH